MESENNQDWPNLKRYEDENLLLGDPQENEKRVVFMGDSITEEWSKLYPNYFEERSYINRGIGGQTTPQMLIRFKQDVVDLRPALVVILAGTNDIAGNTGPANVKMITDNIFSMATIATAHEIQVVLSSVLPVYIYEWSPEIIDPPSTIDAVNERLKEHAASNGIEYLDYFSEMVDDRKGLKKEYTPDGVHPNEKGYELMSAIAEKKLKSILGF
jgi:lysophospholipase L1-like esterase